jgi:cytochrome c553
MNTKKYLLLILPLVMIFTFNGKKYEDEVIKRIHIAANVCIEGAECGVASIANSSDAAATASSKLYAGCVACHGAKGEGGVGPSLRGTSAEYIETALLEYKNQIPRGPQSVLMYSQASALSEKDIKELSKYIVTL